MKTLAMIVIASSLSLLFGCSPGRVKDTTDRNLFPAGSLVDRLIGPAIKVDVSANAKLDQDYQVSVADFQAWETRNGRIPDDSIVLLQTGWSEYWNDRMKYLGTDRRGADAVPELHFPGLQPEAARWLTENRKIAVGLDTASIDFGQSQLFESHRVLMGHNIPAFEK